MRDAQLPLLILSGSQEAAERTPRKVQTLVGKRLHYVETEAIQIVVAMECKEHNSTVAISFFLCEGDVHECVGDDIASALKNLPL